MSITNNNTIAKIAATVAATGLVALAFAPFAQADTTDLQSQINSLLAEIASLQSQLGQSGGSATGGYTFNTDLTIGSSGADVTALQTWLISKGYSIPAGATGYFGTQTKAAVAAFQAANGITPAAGYFGPITRAKVNSMQTTTVSTGTGTGSTGTGTSQTLSGGEATLTNYQLITGNTVSAGDTGDTIATAKFDVKGGDINVGRVTVELQANSSSYSEDPWLYFQKLYVYDGNTQVGSINVSNRSSWDDNTAGNAYKGVGDVYSVQIPTNDIIKEGDTANLTIEADAQNTIDTDNQGQTFLLDIPDQGIRALDAAGIQEYVGSTGDTVHIDFNGNNAGKLTVSEDTNDPQAGILVADQSQSTDNLTVYKFDLQNTENSDALIDSIDVQVATTTGSTTPPITDIIRQATLTDSNGNTFDGTIDATGGSQNATGGTDSGHIYFNFNNNNEVVKSNSTDVFTLTISLLGQQGNYSATGTTLQFSLDDGSTQDVKAEGVQNGQVTPVSGTANGKVQTIALNGGITVSGNSSNNTAVLENSGGNNPDNYGAFTLVFQVTAVGDNVYIPKSIASTSAASSTAGVVIAENLAGTAVVGTTSASVSSSATVTSDGYYYQVNAGSSQNFTASVVINPTTGAFYQVGLTAVRFTPTDTYAALSSLETLNVDDTQPQFQTPQLYIPYP